ncbi:MAG: hypothetical protein AAFN70_08350 [Planctomycetota bacterium]
METYDDHIAALDNPVNAKTLREQTTRYDGCGRPTLATTWIVARDVVDIEDPPIAGLGGVPASDGFTTQFLYRDELTDGVGLDSPAGMNLLVFSGTPVDLGPGMIAMQQFVDGLQARITNPFTIALARLLGPRWMNGAPSRHCHFA